MLKRMLIAFGDVHIMKCSGAHRGVKASVYSLMRMLPETRKGSRCEYVARKVNKDALYKISHCRCFRVSYVD